MDYTFIATSESVNGLTESLDCDNYNDSEVISPDIILRELVKLIDSHLTGKVLSTGLHGRTLDGQAFMTNQVMTTIDQYYQYCIMTDHESDGPDCECDYEYDIYPTDSVRIVITDGQSDNPTTKLLDRKQVLANIRIDSKPLAEWIDRYLAGLDIELPVMIQSYMEGKVA